MTRTRNPWISVCVAVAFLAGCAMVYAGPAPTGRGKKAGGEGQGRTGATGGEQGRSGVTESQKPTGFITKFALAKPGDAEDIAGKLSIKPVDSKTVNIEIPREGVVYRFGDRVIDAEAAFELLGKGLYCSAGWGYADTGDAKKKPTVKQLTSLTLEMVIAEGTIEEIGSDFIVIKVRPTRGDWPDADVDIKKQSTALTKVIKPRPFKLKTPDNISKFTNKEGKPGDSGDYQNGDKIEVTFVYSKTAGSGILEVLRHPYVKATTGGRGQEEEKKAPRPPPGPTGPKKPRGGG
ncbi:MAG: hypothetical protein AABZ08_08640 [Planctomycetota bacterium]